MRPHWGVCPWSCWHWWWTWREGECYRSGFSLGKLSVSWSPRDRPHFTRDMSMASGRYPRPGDE